MDAYRGWQIEHRLLTLPQNKHIQQLPTEVDLQEDHPFRDAVVFSLNTLPTASLSCQMIQLGPLASSARASARFST